MTETRNTQRQDYIIDHLSANSFEDVMRLFFNQSLGMIQTMLDDIFPQDDNEELACMIYEEVNR